MFPRWLRPMVVAVVLFGLLSLSHVVYLRLQPELRRALRFPPLPPASTPYPPLPVIEDLDVLIDFFRTSLDDVAEDTTKAMCVAASYSIGWTLVGDRSFAMARTAGMTMGLGSYMACDRAGDAIGDYAASLITSAMSFLGFVPPLPEGKREKDMTLISRVADDAMEDSFKLVCLWSHVMIGGLLGDNLIVNTFGTQSSTLNWAIRLGVPAAKYNLCNIYGDYLGEWVHYHIGHMTRTWPIDPLGIGDDGAQRVGPPLISDTNAPHPHHSQYHDSGLASCTEASNECVRAVPESSVTMVLWYRVQAWVASLMQWLYPHGVNELPHAPHQPQTPKRRAMAGVVWEAHAQTSHRQQQQAQGGRKACGGEEQGDTEQGAAYGCATDGPLLGDGSARARARAAARLEAARAYLQRHRQQHHSHSGEAGQGDVGRGDLGEGHRHWEGEEGTKQQWEGEARGWQKGLQRRQHGQQEREGGEARIDGEGAQRA